MIIKDFNTLKKEANVEKIIDIERLVEKEINNIYNNMKMRLKSPQGITKYDYTVETSVFRRVKEEFDMSGLYSTKILDSGNLEIRPIIK